MKIQLIMISALLIAMNVFAFETKQCVTSSLDFQLDRKPILFGLFPHILKAKKSRCEIEVFHKKILEKTWQVDLCREPIHIKFHGLLGDDLYSRTMACSGTDSSGAKSENEFCAKAAELLQMIEAEALLYAKGEREDLGSGHGKFYCLYILLKEYLGNNEILTYSQADKYQPMNETLAVNRTKEGNTEETGETNETSDVEKDSRSANRNEKNDKSNAQKPFQF